MPNLTIQKALEFAVKTEETGAKVYAELAERFSEVKETGEIFSQLAEDEKFHGDQFSNLLQKFNSGSEKAIEGNTEFLLKATSDPELMRSGFLKAEKELSPQDALIGALEFEKATLLNYQILKDILSPSELLDEIIKTEKSHIIALMKVIIPEAKFRGLGDNAEEAG